MFLKYSVDFTQKNPSLYFVPINWQFSYKICYNKLKHSFSNISLSDKEKSRT